MHHFYAENVWKKIEINKNVLAAKSVHLEGQVF